MNTIRSKVDGWLQSNKLHRILFVIAIPIVFIIVVIVAYHLKVAGILKLDCTTKEWFGIDCPACGTTRLIGSLLKGEIYQAFRYNPMVFLCIPYSIAVYVIWGIKYIKDGVTIKLIGKALLLLAISLSAFGIIRNIPCFNFLLPTKV